MNSLSDLFHEGLTDNEIDRVFAVMALCPQHRFQVLTKRADRMAGYLTVARQRLADRFELDVTVLRGAPVKGLRHLVKRFTSMSFDESRARLAWPPPNVWLGVSVESRDYLHRIDDLRRTPAAVRFLSLEPLLEDFGNLGLSDCRCAACGLSKHAHDSRPLYADERVPHVFVGAPGIDWVIVGGESGKGARPMHPGWVRSIRDQCVEAGVPFFFKQWGEYLPDGQNPQMDEKSRLAAPEWAGIRYGKKAAGTLDGRTWDEMPDVKA